MEAKLAKKKKEADKIDHLKERIDDLNILEEKFGEEERRIENEIITFKTQLEEAKKIEESMKNQMMKREEEVEKLKEQVVMLRSKIIKFNDNK